MTSPHRKEAPGPVYKWRCALDTYKEFRQFLLDTYGLRCGDPTTEEGHTLPDLEGRQTHRFVHFRIGPTKYRAEYDGEVTNPNSISARRRWHSEKAYDPAYIEYLIKQVTP